MASSSSAVGGAPAGGYFDSPQTLARTAQKLADNGYLDEAGSLASVQQCIRAYHDHVDEDVLAALQPHIPAGISDEVDAQYAVKELANIVSTSLANYARASSEMDRLKAAETIQAALVRRREADHAAAAAAAARDPVEERSAGGVEGGDAATRRTVVFSRLSPREKEQFMQFLVRNRVAFSKAGDGEFVAAVRLIPKKAAVPPNLHDDSSLLDEGPPPVNARYEEELFGKRRARPPQDHARIVRAMAKNSNFDFDFADYPKFTALLSQDGSQQPRIRPLPWLLRIIEDVYEARFAFDKKRVDADEEEGAGGGGSGDAGLSDDDRLSVVFPVFVIDFFSRKYGVRALVDQNALDLLQSVHQFRDSFLEVEVFARFLETFYDPEDLLFFLYLRSILEKHLGKGYFRKRWHDLGPGREKLHESTWVSYALSTQVCRLAFGEDRASRQHCADCLELVHKYSEPIGSGDQAPRRIRVIHLLQLMLDQYHRARPAQSDADSAAFLESQQLGQSSNGGSGGARIESKDEQDRLFREAERHYEEFAKSRGAGARDDDGADGGGGDDDGDGDGESPGTSTYVQRAQEERQKRIRAMEDRIRAEIASKRGQPPPQQQPQGDADDNGDGNGEAGAEQQGEGAAPAAFEAEEEEEDRLAARSTASLLQEIDQSIQTPGVGGRRGAGGGGTNDNGGDDDDDGDLPGLLDLLGKYLQAACNAEVSRIVDVNRPGLRGLPQTFVEMIWSEASQKLQQKVEDIMKQLIDKSPDVDAAFAASFRGLRSAYRQAGGRRGGEGAARAPIEHFCDQFVRSIRAQLEDLFAGLVATAQDHARKTRRQQHQHQHQDQHQLQQQQHQQQRRHGGGGGGDRAGGDEHSPHKIHISRRGSVNIELGN